MECSFKVRKDPSHSEGGGKMTQNTIKDLSESLRKGMNPALAMRAYNQLSYLKGKKEPKYRYEILHVIHYDPTVRVRRYSISSHYNLIKPAGVLKPTNYEKVWKAKFRYLQDAKAFVKRRIAIDKEQGHISRVHVKSL